MNRIAFCYTRNESDTDLSYRYANTDLLVANA